MLDVSITINCVYRAITSVNTVNTVKTLLKERLSKSLNDDFFFKYTIPNLSINEGTRHYKDVIHVRSQSWISIRNRIKQHVHYYLNLH